MVSFLFHKCLQFASFPTTPAKNLKKFTESTYDTGESAKTMQSRLASTTTRFNQLLLEQFRPRRLASASASVSPFRITGTAHPTPTQQARPNSTGATTTPVEDVSCAGLDGTPWPEDIRKQEEDDKEYFKHHKASPLSAVEVVDTRKPITRATDGTVESYGIGEAGGGVIRWRPEQLDTAEEALRRAVEIWRQNVMRGDPDSPHGRVLRMLRGENW